MSGMWVGLGKICDILWAEGDIKTNKAGVHKGKLRQKELPTIWIAVDAARTEGRGVVFLNEKGEVMTRMWIRNAKEEEAMCAFVLEVELIPEGVERIGQKDMGDP